MDQNQIIIEGTIKDAPFYRAGQDGKNSMFSLIVVTEVEDPEDHRLCRATHRVTCWGLKADAASQLQLRQFGRVYVEGRMNYGSYTDRNGQRIPTSDINAAEIQPR